MDWKTLWARLEERLLRVMDERGESRNSLSQKVGRGRHYLNPHLGQERRPGEEPKASFRHAFEAAEALDHSATAVLAPFCAGEPPERALATLYAEGDDRGKNKARKTRDEERDDELLAAARRLIERIPCSPGTFETPWPKRRFEDPDFEPVYRELEELDVRRHSEPLEVAERCHEAIVGAAACDAEASPPDAVRLVGYLGLWGTVQRTRFRLRPARDAFVLCIPFARRLGDPSLLANQLQRSAYAFRDLGHVEMGVQVLDEAMRNYSLDANRIGNAYLLVEHGNMAFHQNDLGSAERFYLAGLRELPKEGHSVYRVAATQGAATCRDVQGDVEGALTFLVSAASSAESCTARLRPHLLHPAANIQRRLGKLEEAEHSYRESLKAFQELEDIDMLVRVCVDLATCLLMAGKSESLSQIRSIVLQALPKLRDREALKFQCECLLLELSRESVELAQLHQISNELQEIGGKGPGQLAAGVDDAS